MTYRTMYTAYLHISVHEPTLALLIGALFVTRGTINPPLPKILGELCYIELTNTTECFHLPVTFHA